LVAWHRRHAAAAALGPLSESVSGSRPARAGWARCHCRGKETRRGREAGRRGRWAHAGRAWLLHRSQRSSALWRWRRSRRQASGGGGAEAEAERGGRALLPRSAPCMLASWSSSPPSSSARSSARLGGRPSASSDVTFACRGLRGEEATATSGSSGADAYAAQGRALVSTVPYRPPRAGAVLITKYCI
jgi:hypothetical protein